MHPSDAIRGSKSSLLKGRRIVLGVSGSIAAVEVPRIVREILRHGAEVRIVASPDALKIITEEALTFASGHPTVRTLTGQVEHVSLLGPGEGRADLLLIAPATANTISKVAHGIDDTPVTSFASIALGGRVPILLAPAMHAHMSENPAIQENLTRLRSWGVEVIATQTAEGEEKLAAPEDIAAAVLHRLARGPWAGRPVVVIGGASREPIDEVRSITNESSGETAVALAVQAHFRGAEVAFWAGGLTVPLPAFLTVQRWISVGDLLKLSNRESARLNHADAILVPAALSDFTLPARAGKIPSRGTPSLHLELKPSPKVLRRLRQLAPPPTLLIGFKLEVGRDEAGLARAAGALLEETQLDLVVANDRATIGQARATYLMVGAKGERHWVSGSKFEAAGRLWDDLAALLANAGARPSGGAPSRSRPRHRSSGIRRRSARR
ncbi:MAG: bifunctional phosphopantothenoylcysteine decarboxylase/phosphopantothenate--cysteine ligase CoaBC [Thermoplasmata archaeon]|nr:bifunctional phosphopantothenoylcysteine decarboxylase/phosphopantothenate--cysteine ligase CoaBC [Thermoplasmata archaeon]MCI4359018.1 bifunctional phosphopantothenoylcysteine decarboxylase/phosphopantothenate--cysteine ligase CoaBC [Thermoplasmata archaeon]